MCSGYIENKEKSVNKLTRLKARRTFHDKSVLNTSRVKTKHVFVSYINTWC